MKAFRSILKTPHSKTNALIATNMKDMSTRWPKMMKFVSSLYSFGFFFVKNVSHTSGKTIMAMKK